MLNIMRVESSAIFYVAKCHLLLYRYIYYKFSGNTDSSSFLRVLVWTV
jgi:hypothetical protein